MQTSVREKRKMDYGLSNTPGYDRPLITEWTSKRPHRGDVNRPESFFLGP